MMRFKPFTHMLAITAALALALTASTPAFAKESEKSIGRVIAVKQSGYATRLQQSVKHTIKVGDPLYSGDQLDVKAGNVVQIALDADKNNIIHIPGDSLVQLSKDRAINLDVSRGQVFALLDKLESGTRFRVTTPTAISTVRGTYFGVKTIGTATITSVYRGEVGMSGRLPNGKALGASVPITAGDRALVAHAGTSPQDPIHMTATEFNEINTIIASLDGLKKPVDFGALGLSDAKQEKKDRDRDDIDINKSAKDKDSDEESNSGGKVVF